MNKVLVKGFVTFVCKYCGNVARNIKTHVCNHDDEHKLPCKVCNKIAWRKCVLDEKREVSNNDY